MPISTNIKGVVALYDVSDDWIPIYDKSSLPGFYMAVGTSGNQFKNAPVAGMMMNLHSLSTRIIICGIVMRFNLHD